MSNLFHLHRLWPVLASLGLTLLVWIVARVGGGGGWPDGWIWVAKGAALLTVVLMSWSLLLSTRWAWIERWLGGLDKVYQAHKRIGRWAFVLIWLHPLALALRRWPEWQPLLTNFLPRWSTSEFAWAFNAGVVGFYGLILLVVLSLWGKLPYHLWKRTHEWLGPVFLLVTLHVLWIDRDVNRYPLLAAWMYGWMLLGLFAYVYIRGLYRFIGPRYAYRVADVERLGNSLEISFEPTGKKMDFKPSQFVYLVIDKSRFSREPHPFSIACGYNREARFKLGIRTLGDYTSHLAELQIGDPVRVYGPYGQFSDKFLLAERDCVFVAGGIGITPFLGMWHVALNSQDQHAADQLPQHLHTLHPELIRDWESPRVALFYAEQDESTASFHNDIIQEVIVSQFEGFEHFEQRGHYYELFLREESGYLTAEHIAANTPGGIEGKYIFLCGPPVMMQALIEQFRMMGVPNRLIITENFQLVG